METKRDYTEVGIKEVLELVGLVYNFWTSYVSNLVKVVRVIVVLHRDWKVPLIVRIIKV